MSEIIDGMRWYQGKRFVASVRGSDYAHAGEEEAIHLCFEKFSKDPHRLILDAGCGQGGTAHFIQTQGWGKVSGFDIEEKSILYAQNKYPDVKFYTADAHNLAAADEALHTPQFDLICLFNAFYAFSDQKKSLQNLRACAKTGADLMIFDYTDLAEEGKNPFVIQGETTKIFLPIRSKKMLQMIAEIGWTCVEIKDLSQEYKHWYKNLVDKILENKQQLISDFNEHNYFKAIEKYTNLYNAFKNKLLGGCIFYAQAV